MPTETTLLPMLLPMPMLLLLLLSKSQAVKITPSFSLLAVRRK